MSKVIYTFGVFDLLHVGHVKLLEKAKELGDTLIVGVYTDEVAESFKRKPIIPFEQRLEMIKALKIVDDVVPQDEMSPQKNIFILRPFIVCKAEGAGWGPDCIPQFENTISVLLPYTKGVSTSEIIKKCKESK